MTVWFTSDLHIGHEKVAEERALGCMICPAEGEAAVEWHDNLLAHAWCSLVQHDDVVWVLGDISAGGNRSQRRALDWLKQMPGKKHLIVGNHDGCHPMHRDSHKWQRIYLEAFESVQMAARRHVPTTDGRVPVLLSHLPYSGDHTPAERLNEWRLRDEGLPVLHGHVHSVQPETRSVNGSRQIDVGVDAWDLCPVSLEQIGEMLS